MKHDEEFCHSALMRFLSQTCSVESRPGTEPPDFYLYWNGKEFFHAIFLVTCDGDVYQLK
ncbi:MAG: hypothetical protein U9O50_04795 [Acidobacteriota bacterium]|nr:hypothetical protein [Acidobacteriota bacterium]